MPISEPILAMLRPLTSSLAALWQEAAHNFSKRDFGDLISVYFVAAYFVYLIDRFYTRKRFFDKTFWFCLTLFLMLLHGGESDRSMLYVLRNNMCIPSYYMGSDIRRVWGHNTGLFRELRCTLSVQYPSRACKWLSTTAALLSKAISRVARYTNAWLQDPDPIHLSRCICRLGRYTGACFQDRLTNRLTSYISRLGLQTKAWLKSPSTAAGSKLLFFSTMAFVLDLIVEPLRRRIMGGYPSMPWPPTSAIGSLVSHISLMLVGLVQDTKMKLRHFACMLRTTWQYLSPTFPGGLHYGLRLTIASTVADIIDVLITLVCLAVFLAIALGYQVVLFTMAVRLLEKMFSVSVFNQVDH